MKRRERVIKIGFFAWGFGLLIYIAPFVGITYVPPLIELIVLVYLVGWLVLPFLAGGFQQFGLPKGFLRIAFQALPKLFTSILVLQLAWIQIFETGTTNATGHSESIELFSVAGVQNACLVVSWFYGFIVCMQLFVIRLIPLLQVKKAADASFSGD